MGSEVAEPPLIAYLDTNVALWLLNNDLKKLTEEAKKVIRRASLRISPMVLLEFEYLLEIRRTKPSTMEMVGRLQAQLDVELCDFPFPLIAQAAIHEKWTRDAFDRLIVAHARANKIAALVSADQLIQTNYSATIW